MAPIRARALPTMVPLGSRSRRKYSGMVLQIEPPQIPRFPSVTSKILRILPVFLAFSFNKGLGFGA